MYNITCSFVGDSTIRQEYFDLLCHLSFVFGEQIVHISNHSQRVFARFLSNSPSHKHSHTLSYTHSSRYSVLPNNPFAGQPFRSQSANNYTNPYIYRVHGIQLEYFPSGRFWYSSFDFGRTLSSSLVVIPYFDIINLVKKI